MPRLPEIWEILLGVLAEVFVQPEPRRVELRTIRDEKMLGRAEPGFCR